MNIKNKKSIIVIIVITLLVSIGMLKIISNHILMKDENKSFSNLSNIIAEKRNTNYGIFNDYYELAENKVKNLTLEQKIGQMLMVSYDNIEKMKADREILNNYGGVLFFEKDFKNKTEEQVRKMINNINAVSNIKILTAVDEEGKSGNSGVIRVSSNENLTSSNSYLQKKPFQNSQTLYKLGGFDLIKKDTIEKSKFLYNLGINLNLAPVADICKEGDYMYNRSVGLDYDGTANYVKTVINAGKDAKKNGYEVSYCLKHFPGYGSNSDTHIGFSVDKRNYEEVKKDMVSFETGIKEKAEAVMISHNIVSSIDENNPASLSTKINAVLRNELNFTGVIITDALNMGALDNIQGNKYIKAVLAGNDILIVTDGKKASYDIKLAVEQGEIKEEFIDKAVTKIIAWKYYKNML